MDGWMRDAPPTRGFVDGGGRRHAQRVDERLEFVDAHLENVRTLSP